MRPNQMQFGPSGCGEQNTDLGTGRIVLMNIFEKVFSVVSSDLESSMTMMGDIPVWNKKMLIMPVFCALSLNLLFWF